MADPRLVARAAHSAVGEPRPVVEELHPAAGEPLASPGDGLNLRGPRMVNRLFYRVATALFRRPILSWFQLTPVNAGVVPTAGAGLVLANHAALFDPIWLYAMLPRPVYFAATEDLFRQPLLARVIRWFGAFPKRKNASGDIGAMRSIFHLLKTGCLVGIYPEGVRTWDGTNSPIIPGIARLIQKLRVPVYTCRTEGSYLAQPRWASRYRRIPMRGVFSRLYAGDAIPADERLIVSDITTAIRNPDYEMDIDPALDRRKGLAVNVTRLLYRCPACGTQEGLKIVLPHSSNRIECSSCFSSWVVNAASRLAETDENGQPEGDWVTLAELYAHILEMPLVPIRPVARLGLAEGEQLFLASRPRFLFKQERFPDIRVFAFGRLFLTSRRLVFRTRLGIPLDAQLESIGSLSVDPGDKLHFTLAGKLYRIPFRNESAMKWFDAIRRLQSQIAAGRAGGAAPLGAAASRGAGRGSARPRGS
jgi:1-acyl-sn-glycerol-3-phosphate acyltransferase